MCPLTAGTLFMAADNRHWWSRLPKENDVKTGTPRNEEEACSKTFPFFFFLMQLSKVIVKHIHIFFFIFFSIIGYYKISSGVPCAIQLGRCCLSVLYIVV